MTDETPFDMSEEAEDDEEYVEKDDLFIRRDSEGDVLPVEENAAGYGKVMVYPMTYGQIQEEFGEVLTVEDIGPDMVADLMSRYVAEPDLSDLTGDDVRKRMEPMAPQAILMAILRASGLDAQVDVGEGGEAEIDFAGNTA